MVKWKLRGEVKALTETIQASASHWNVVGQVWAGGGGMVGRWEGLGAGSMRERRQSPSRGRGGGVVGERVCRDSGRDRNPSTRQRWLMADEMKQEYCIDKPVVALYSS